MTVYQYRCISCNHRFDNISSFQNSPATLPCPRCQSEARYIIAVSSVDTESECPNWLKATTEVVNPDGGYHCKEFIRNPTRENYRKWMQGEGLRPSECGERPERPSFDSDRHRRLMHEERAKRNRIVI